MELDEAVAASSELDEDADAVLDWVWQAVRSTAVSRNNMRTFTLKV